MARRVSSNSSPTAESRAKRSISPGLHPTRYNFAQVEQQHLNHVALARRRSQRQLKKLAGFSPLTVLPEGGIRATVDLYHASLEAAKPGKIVRLDDSLWEPCVLVADREQLQYGTSTVSMQDVVRVTVPPELGAFVFQVRVQQGPGHGNSTSDDSVSDSDESILTFRAQSLSDLSDCCECLWGLAKCGSPGVPQMPSSPVKVPHGEQP